MPRLLRRYFVSASIWALLSTLSGSLGIVAVNVILVRILEPNNVGAYLVAFSVMTVLPGLAILGTNLSVMRYISESIATSDRGRARDAMLKTCTIAGLGILVTSCFLLSESASRLWEEAFGATQLVTLSGLLALWLVSQSIRDLCAGVLRGFRLVRDATLVETAIFNLLLILGVAGVAVVVERASLALAIAVTVVASLAGMLYGVYLLVPKYRSLGVVRSTTLSLPKVIGTSLPLYFVGRAPLISAQASLWIVAAYLDMVQVAIFGVATRVMQVVILPNQILRIALLPVIASLNLSETRTDLEQIVRSLATASTLPVVLVFVFIWIFGEPLILFVFGATYGPAASVFVILVFGRIAHVVLGPADMLLSMTGEEKYVLWVTVGTTLLLVGGSVAVVNAYGVHGVAWAASGAYTVRCVILWAACRKRMQIRCHASFSLGALRRGLRLVSRVK